jgi:hypothetical protein
MDISQHINKTDVTAMISEYPFRVSFTGTLTPLLNHPEGKGFYLITSTIGLPFKDDMVIQEDWVTSMTSAAGSESVGLSLDLPVTADHTELAGSQK